MKQKIKYAILGTIFFLMFLFFTIIVRDNFLNQFDYDFTVVLQNHILRSFDTFLSIFSLFGSLEITTIILIIILLQSKKWQNSLFLITFLGGHAFELVGKTFLTHPGPPYRFFRYDLGFLFPSSYVHTQSSYPSGHAFRALFICVVVLFLFFYPKIKRRLGNYIWLSAVLIITAIMLISRVSLGEHWPTDVIGGCFLALSMTGFTIAIRLSHRV